MKILNGDFVGEWPETREVCGATIEGPRAKGTRSAVTWRKTCRAKPMGNQTMPSFITGRCFQHQSSDFRNEWHRLKSC